MGAKASTTAGSAVKRAFPTAHRAAAEAVQSKTRGALDVTRDAPIHLRAAAASAKGDLDGLDPATTSSTTTTTSTSSTNTNTNTNTPSSGGTNPAFDGPLDLDHLSHVVEPGLLAGGTRADTLASSKQASYVEELRNQYVADMKTQADPAYAMSQMMQEVGHVDSHDKLRANQKLKEESVAVVRAQRTGVLNGEFVQLRHLLYEADDLAEADGDPHVLPLRRATKELASAHGMDEDSVEMLLRLHAMPAYVNEVVQVGRDDMNEGNTSTEKRWKGYWPHQINEE